MMKNIKIDNKMIGPDYPCYIIAEMSANHNQDFEKAKNLIEIAKECGSDAVKMQTYTPDTLTIDCNNEFFRIKDGPWKGQTLYELYKKAYMPWDWQADLKKYADEIGITLFSTPFDKTAVDFLEKIGVAAYKIASFEVVDIPLIRYVASKGKPVIVSTGMASNEEIELAVKTIKEQGNNDIILLKCTSAYPAKIEEMNLSNIRLLSETFEVIAGLSDHSMDERVAMAAVSIGAKVIEKHVTISRSDGGPDISFSLEPNEFKKMVENIRVVEKAIGNSGLEPTQGEKENIIFRKSIFVADDIKRGERFTEKNIRCIRPGHGLNPKYYEEILGQKVSKDLKRGSPLTWDCIHKD
jgi:pseudaminic acid synthase